MHPEHQEDASFYSTSGTNGKKSSIRRAHFTILVSLKPEHQPWHRELALHLRVHPRSRSLERIGGEGGFLPWRPELEA
ncbi:hypothetical protein QWA68_005693 [Fusarium oxysporum]|nr:hypothetical protein QWA68_005693 [Fusarium oxysporum]